MNGQEWDHGRNEKVSGNKWKSTHNNPKLMGHSVGSPEREVHSNTGLPKENWNISSKRPNPISKRTIRTITNKPQSK